MDVPALLVIVVLILTPRALVIIFILSKKLVGSAFNHNFFLFTIFFVFQKISRNILYKQMGLLFLDILALLCFSVVVITVYRIPQTWRDISRVSSLYFKYFSPSNQLFSSHSRESLLFSEKIHMAIFYQALGLLRDIPTLLKFISIHIAVWRAAFFWWDYYVQTIFFFFFFSLFNIQKNTGNFTHLLNYHFSQIPSDIINFPFFFLASIIMITIWRFPTLRWHLAKVSGFFPTILFPP